MEKPFSSNDLSTQGTPGLGEGRLSLMLEWCSRRRGSRCAVRGIHLLLVFLDQMHHHGGEGEASRRWVPYNCAQDVLFNKSMLLRVGSQDSSGLSSTSLGGDELVLSHPRAVLSPFAHVSTLWWGSGLGLGDTESLPGLYRCRCGGLEESLGTGQLKASFIQA